VEFIENPTLMSERSAQARRAGHTLGFVPTMGALHEGHLDLVKRARADHGTVICSIFVNPLQFNNAADLANYPRQLERDIPLLEQAGCDVLFAPNKETLFHGFTPTQYDLGGLDAHWEGPSRPGHFQGVVNVVERLFFHVRPDAAYFGEKDRQQVTIIRHMAHTLHWPERIVPCPTVRAADGLALSSRNQRLNERERRMATVLYKALTRTAELAFREPLPSVLEAAMDVLSSEPEVVLDHFGIAHPEDLRPLTEWPGSDTAVALIAAQVGPVRLIDNMTLNRPTGADH
jgi:pantoate--beta-alanine ligase